RVRSDVNARRSPSTDVETALTQARSLDTIVNRGTAPTQVRTSWMQLRSELDTLAGYYNATASWDRGGNSGNGFPDRDNRRFGYYASDTDMRSLVTRLRSDQSLFRSSYNRWSRSNWRGILGGNSADVDRSLTELDQAI